MNQHHRKNARITSFLRRALKPLFVVCAIAPVLGFHDASAAVVTQFWDQGGTGTTGNWDHATTNWSAVAPPTAVTAKWTDGNIASFSGTGGTITLTDDVNNTIVSGIKFTTNGYTINDDNNGAELEMDGASTITVNTGIAATINTAINSVFSASTLLINGGGTLTLTGQNNGSYFGSTVTISGGTTVKAAVNPTLGTGNFAIPNSALVLTGAAGTPDKLDLNGTSQSIASLASTGTNAIITNGNAANAYSILTIGQGALSSPTTYSGQITDTATTIATTASPTPAGGLGITITSVTAGYTLILSNPTPNNNNYHGITTVGTDTTTNPAVLKAGAAGVFSAKSVVDVRSSGTLDLNGFAQTIAALQGTGTGTVTNTKLNTTALLTIGDATLTGTLVSNASLVDGTGNGKLALTKNGAYSQVLAGNNTYSGATNITAGVLANGSFNSGTGLSGLSGNSAYTVGAGAVLDLNGFSGAVGSLTGAGTAIVTNGSGSVTGPTLGNATLTVGSDNTSTTYSGVIEGGASGTLGLTKTGTGVFTLSGNNIIYTGATTVNDGTLQAGSAGGFASGSAFTVNRNVTSSLGILDVNGFATTIGSLAGNGTVTNNAAGAGSVSLGGLNTSTTFTGLIQNGTGVISLTKTGTGTQTLGGTSTYTGTTTITTGTLQAGSSTGFSPNSATSVASGAFIDVNGFNPTVGSLTGTGIVTNNATGALGSLVTGSDNTSTAFTGLLKDGTSPFGLTKVGTGVFTISNSTYSGPTNVNGGTLQAGAAAGFSPNSAFNVSSPGIVDLNGFSPTIGSLAGTGTVTNLGAHLSVLTAGGNNTDTTFSGLILDGSAAGTTALTKTGTGAMTLGGANTFSGGTILQNGSIIVANPQALGKGNVAVNGGILKAAGGPTSIQVGGNYTQSGAGELDLRIGGTTAGTFDRLAVTGSASLGGRLSVSSANNFAPKNGDKVAVITAGGGVQGQFQQVAGNLSTFPLVKLTVNYLPGEVDLTFGQGSFMAAATTFHLDLTPNQKAVAFALDHIRDDSRAARLLNVLDSIPMRSLPGAYDLIAPAEYGAIYQISRSAARMQANSVENRLDEIHASATPTGASGPAGPADGKDYKGSKEVMPPPEYRLGVFANGSGEFVSVGNSSNAAGYNFDSGGVTAGVDYRFTEHFVAGLLFNYTRTSADLVDNGRLTADAFRGGIYASLFGGGAYVNAFLGAGYNDYDMRRAGLGGSAHGDPNGGEFNALIAAGYDAHAGNFTYGPVASFQYTYTGVDSANETGSLAPLHLDSGNGDSLMTNVGVRATYDCHIGSMVLVPEVRATWQHQFGNSFDQTTANIFDSPNFTVTSAPIGRDSLVLTAGFTLRITPRVSAYAFYDGELARTNYSASNVLVGMRASF